MSRGPYVPAQLTQAPFMVDEALRAGLSRRQLRGASWRPMGSGFYVWAGLPDLPTLPLLIAQRRLPKETVFSGRTAAWLHGLDLIPCDPVEVTVPDPIDISLRAGVVIRRAKLCSSEVVRLNGLPVTSLLRTLLDLAASQSVVEAVVATDTALHNRLVSLVKLRAYVVANRSHRGSGRLRRVVGLAEPATESPMETRLRLVLVLGGLPRPSVQVAIFDQQRNLLGRPDLYYASARLGLEYDGAWHRGSLAEDVRRQNRLLAAGIRLLRFTAADVRGAPELIVRQVGALLGEPPRSSFGRKKNRARDGEPGFGLSNEITARAS